MKKSQKFCIEKNEKSSHNSLIDIGNNCFVQTVIEKSPKEVYIHTGLGFFVGEFMYLGMCLYTLIYICMYYDSIYIYIYIYIYICVYIYICIELPWSDAINTAKNRDIILNQKLR
jgi:hypothetical protein